MHLLDIIAHIIVQVSVFWRGGQNLQGLIKPAHQKVILTHHHSSAIYGAVDVALGEIVDLRKVVIDAVKSCIQLKEDNRRYDNIIYIL